VKKKRSLRRTGNRKPHEFASAFSGQLVHNPQSGPFGILDPSRPGGAAPRELRLITGTARHSSSWGLVGLHCKQAHLQTRTEECKRKHHCFHRGRHANICIPTSFGEFPTIFSGDDLYQLIFQQPTWKSSYAEASIVPFLYLLMLGLCCIHTACIMRSLYHHGNIPVKYPTLEGQSIGRASSLPWCHLSGERANDTVQKPPSGYRAMRTTEYSGCHAAGGPVLLPCLP